MGIHACPSTSIFKTTSVFFSGKCDFSVLPLSLQSVIYGSFPHRISRFLESVATTQTIMTLAYNTQQSQNFLSFSPSAACLTLKIYLVIYGCCSQQFLCLCNYTSTCLSAGFCACPHTIKLCLPHRCHTHDKMHQAPSPS